MDYGVPEFSARAWLLGIAVCRAAAIQVFILRTAKHGVLALIPQHFMHGADDPRGGFRLPYFVCPAFK
jgi:hypothetical protein